MSVQHTPPRILVVGSANMDLVVAADRLPLPGETLLGGALATFPGGKGANQAVAAARAGGDVAFYGRVGTDAYGGQLAAALRADRIDTRLLRVVDGPSGVALIITGGGENMIVVAPGANGNATPGQPGLAPFRGIAFVLVQLETPLAEVIEVSKRAAVTGAVLILDPAPARALPADLLARVDWLTPNRTEAATLLGGRDDGDVRDIARALLALGPKGVVLKLGGDGAVLAVPGIDPVHVPPVPTRVIDTTAAGDAFNGAFAVALAEGRAPLDAVRFANTAAAIAVSRMGAQPAMATRAEIDAVFADIRETKA